MSLVHPAVALRRLVARRPSLYWLTAVALATAAALSVHHEVRALRDERDRWHATATVLVARDAASPGDPLVTDTVDLPIALVPPAAITADDIGDRPARRHIAAGDIVTRLDLSPQPGPLALVPAGWRAVPIIESPASAAEVGDRVDVVSDGVVIAADALVVGDHDTVTLVAVPADIAPLLPLAASTSSVTLLRVP